MIIDVVLLWFYGMIATFVELLPPLPDFVTGTLSSLVSGGVWVAAQLGVMAPFLPTDEISTVLTWYLGALGFWVVMIGVRVVLWALGR